MTYQNAQHDANSVPTYCGVSSVDGSVIPIQIDPVTGRVLIEITGVTDESSVTSPEWAQKDANSTATVLAVKSDMSGLGVPVIDRRNNLLFVDILFE